MRLGLIGETLGYSFSAPYFAAKFEQLNLAGHSYENVEIPSMDALESLLESSDFDGFNVTIPYKEKVMPLLNSLSKEAESIGAVNTLVRKNGGWHGANTDHIGFRRALEEATAFEDIPKALVLGSGGASKAIGFALGEMGIAYRIVSRKKQAGSLSYHQAQAQLSNYKLVVNTTPIGTFPNLEERPGLLPQGDLTEHFFMDLIYNPEETNWLSLAKSAGAQVLNGKSMLVYQAEAAWEIWNS